MKDVVVPSDLLERINGANPPLILDVRSGAEFDAVTFRDRFTYRSGQFRGARVSSVRALTIRSLSTAATAHELSSPAPRFRGRGFARVACLSGHMASWREAGYPRRAREPLNPEPETLNLNPGP